MILLTYPIIQNQITNQINKYNHNTTIIFFNPAATSFPVIYCGFKRIIKGDNKRNKGKEGTSSQNSGRVGGFFFLFYHHSITTVDYREAGLLITLW